MRFKGASRKCKAPGSWACRTPFLKLAAAYPKFTIECLAWVSAVHIVKAVIKFRFGKGRMCTESVILSCSYSA